MSASKPDAYRKKINRDSAVLGEVVKKNEALKEQEAPLINFYKIIKRQEDNQFNRVLRNILEFKKSNRWFVVSMFAVSLAVVAGMTYFVLSEDRPTGIAYTIGLFSGAVISFAFDLVKDTFRAPPKG